MKKRRKKLPPGSPQDWLNHAMGDLALAQIGLQADDVLPEQVCFHAQQTVEKALKAVLLHKGIKFPLIHDIEELIEIAQKGGCPLPDWAEEMAMLTPYAVETRYPGHFEDLAETEVSEALDIAERAFEWAKAIIYAKK
jgi:HEPN domain-containing protein